MIKLDIRDMMSREIGLWAQSAGNQMPFATAKALTMSAKAGKEEIERRMPQLIDRPTTYTLDGLRLQRATKARLVSKVEFRPGSRDWLSPIVFGKPRKLKAFERSLQGTGLVPGGYYAMPGSAAKLDAHGNMSMSQIRSIVASVRTWQGPQQGQGKRRRSPRKGVSYFVGQPGGGKLPLGVWQKTTFAMGSAIKPVLIFVSKRPGYRKQLDVQGIAQQIVRQRFPRELTAAMLHALETRRR